MSHDTSLAEPVTSAECTVKMNKSTTILTAIIARDPQTRVDTTRSHFAKLIFPSGAGIVVVLADGLVHPLVEGVGAPAFKYKDN